MTRRAPTDRGVEALLLRLAGVQAREVERHRVRRRATAPLAVGGGQTSRVESVKIAA